MVDNKRDLLLVAVSGEVACTSRFNERDFAREFLNSIVRIRIREVVVVITDYG